MRNWDEFIAGADPTDEDDFLRIERVAVTNAVCVLEFQSKTNRLYALEASPVLSPPISWNTLTNNLPGNGLRLGVPVPVEVTRQFYRLQVRRED